MVAIGAGWPIAESKGSVIVALRLAVIVGLTFGLYPAARAASIAPIDGRRAP